MCVHACHDSNADRSPPPSQVNKLVSELDTLYRSSEQQLKKAEQGEKPAIDTAQLAGLVRDAKQLPELRVRKKTLCL